MRLPVETYQERSKRYDEEWKRAKTGYDFFAWYPVELESGETVWLETVIKQWKAYQYLSGGRYIYKRKV